MTSRPIADYALLSDCHSAALVSSEGSIDWLCLPRFDDPSVFGRLLGADAGHWSIHPAGPFDSRRSYLDESLVLQTRFTTATGVVSVTDALVLGTDERGHEVGYDVPHALVRVVTGVEGRVPMDAWFVPRTEYGLVWPSLRWRDGAVLAQGGADVLVLAGPPPMAVKDAAANWKLEVDAGESVAFALQFDLSWRAPPEPWTQREIAGRLDDTLAAWVSWSDLHQRYEGPWKDLVHHSGRVLQALTFQPTGAIVAAPTTSLPERVGGTRNWDYRYAWIRDASLTLQALWVSACPLEAGRFLSWIIGASGHGLQRGEGLGIMYGVGGEHDLDERELGHLEGWRGSRPVRIGNAAWRQRQNDVYGELLDAVHWLEQQLGEFDEDTSAFLTAVADAAAASWTQPDQGIWEHRGEPRHYLYSKLMCWVALDRAVDLADRLHRSDRAQDWGRTRDEIAEAILTRGWSDRLGAYTQAFDHDDLDATSLMLAITGFLPADDPRMRSTIERVATDLATPSGLIYRYRQDDGLEGDEGTFVLCSYWLAHCFALAGDLGRARDVFDRVTCYANDVGLLSEEIDEGSGQLLGNFPQAFSHVGLVTAAWAIATGEAAAAERGIRA